MSSFTFTKTGLVAAAAALLLGGGILGAGCGGGGTDYTDQSVFCQALAQADCSAAVVTACYGSSAATLETDTTSCITARSTPERCNPDSLPYHAAYAQSCIDANSAAYASAQLDETALQTVAQACVAVFNKAGAQGTTCTADSDCDAGDGFLCVIHASGGTCEMPAMVAAGGQCSDPAAQCATGNYCEAGGHCIADQTMGEACGTGITCGTGLRCDTTNNICAAQLPDAAACTADGDCVGGICITTSTGGQCAATYTFAVGSATCASFQIK